MEFKANKKVDTEEWNEWFAWYPVRLTNADRYVWLEKVQRKEIIGQFDIYLEYKPK